MSHLHNKICVCMVSDLFYIICSSVTLIQMSEFIEGHSLEVHHIVDETAHTLPHHLYT